jgi:hypothetical protein
MDFDDRETVVQEFQAPKVTDASERIIVITKLALKLLGAAKERNKKGFVTLGKKNGRRCRSCSKMPCLLVRELKPVLFEWKDCVKRDCEKNPAYKQDCDNVEKALS